MLPNNRAEVDKNVGIKITIDSREIRNPLAKAIVGVSAVVILLAVLIGVFLLLLPFIWFAVLSILLLMLALLLAVSGSFATRIRRDVTKPALEDKKARK